MTSSPNQSGVYAVAIILILASAAAIALRYKARRIRAAPWKADDWLVSSAMLFTWGLGIILIHGASQGTLGTHTAINPKTGAVIVSPHDNQVSMYSAISQLLTVIALGTLKFGVVMFYRRIFIRDWYRKLSIAVLVIIALWTVAFFFATLFQCNGGNLNLRWKSAETFKYSCYRYKGIQLAHCVTDVATDLVVLAMPVNEVWKLRMTVRQKLVTSLIFLIGFLSTAAGTARLVIFSEDSLETTVGARDVRGVGTNVLVWGYVEVGVGVVAACLPTLKPIFDNRSLDSIVASVRSKVSLRSLNSSTQRGKPGEEVPISSKDLEMLPFDGSNHNESHISGADSPRNLPAGLTEAIIREDNWTVQSERVDGVAGPSSADASK
ncbi:hypothetical protein GGR52DRAFT_190861 [Hypoxylon sp. FL1284]|nr:hypothetical protein GGR52DRAFT_190861 [Hypoxylon sp. FL1284]